MADMNFSFSINVGGQVRTYRKVATADDPVNVNVGPIAIANGQTDKLHSIGGIDISQLKGVFIASNRDVLIEFNSNAGSGGSISLEANVPYTWLVGDVHTLLITADVTAVYITNASGEAAEVFMYFLQDATA
jgi:hypothetical protein